MDQKIVKNKDEVPPKKSANKVKKREKNQPKKRAKKWIKKDHLRNAK